MIGGLETRVWVLRKCGFATCARCSTVFLEEVRDSVWCPRCRADEERADRERREARERATLSVVIVSHETVAAVLEDLRARGPANAAELAARLSLSDRLVRAALDVLATRGVLDSETRDRGGKVETVWWAESPPC